ncbi:MAG: YbaK/EbsC family protein [Halofilum sp. (in: g-proteobacteria)]|nr:YbaK/EbsC family protein [Halofilum sp. (in: g-proteobacteria)]
MASKSVNRFRASLQAAGLADTVVTLEQSARTAREAADALGCEVGQIVKSLVFADSAREPLLVLAAGDVRVDEARVATLHGRTVSLGDAAFVRAVAGFAIGGVPPFGHPAPLATLVDASLLRWGIVWAAAGTPHSVFSLTTEELLRVTGGSTAEVG